MNARRTRIKCLIIAAILVLSLYWASVAVSYARLYLGPWQTYPVGKAYACERVNAPDYKSVKCVFEAEHWYYFWNLDQANLDFFGYVYMWYDGDGKTATVCTWNAAPICARIPWIRK